MAVLALLAKIWQLLTAAGIPVISWIASHQAQIQKAIADIQAGAPLSQVITDLFATTNTPLPMQAQALSCQDCCKAVCLGAAGAIEAVHADTPDYGCAQQKLADAFLAACSCNPS